VSRSVAGFTPLLALLLAALAANARAQDTIATNFVVESRVKLRADPATTAEILKTLSAGEALTLIRPGALRSDFYHVATNTGDTGWVGFPYIRPADSATMSVAEAAAVVTVTNQLGNPATAIDPSWPKPRLRRSIFVATTGKRCQAEGKIDSDWRTNIRKNRPDVPPRSRAVTWEALADTVTLPFARGGLPTRREGWTDEEAAAVARFEGIPITVTGLLVIIKPQSSNGEATNCGFTGEANTDWHIAFVGLSDGSEGESVVIEPTPRFKRRHAAWKRAALRDYEADRRSPGDSVRFTGYLFYDPSHESHLDTFRRTMWEIHPITRIEVFLNGGWVNIDELF
jgi:hypothetical protein